MIDLGPHANFILAAYGVTTVALGALVWSTLADDRHQRRLLAELERQGIRRRSAAKPAEPKVTSTAAKDRTTKPRSSAAPTKRRPATPRARKSSS
jgi:heme exporter protein D